MRNGYASRHSPQATHLIRRLLTQLLSPSPCEGNSKLEDPVRIKDWMPFRTFQERIPGRASERSVTLASPAPGRRQRPSSIPCEALELRYRPPWPAKKAAGRRVRVSIYIPRWEPAASRTGASGRRRRSLYWLLRAPPPPSCSQRMHSCCALVRAGLFGLVPQHLDTAPTIKGTRHLLLRAAPLAARAMHPRPCERSRPPHMPIVESGPAAPRAVARAKI